MSIDEYWEPNIKDLLYINCAIAETKREEALDWLNIFRCDVVRKMRKANICLKSVCP